MEKNQENLHILRHSASHIMAQAVQKLFPGTKLAIGPAVDNGFYFAVVSDFRLRNVNHRFTNTSIGAHNNIFRTFNHGSFIICYGHRHGAA